ncbi:C40 family peptidase [Novilysobacter defluvii]|uniref:NLP/P60 protein n=1 Tax=Lysobacter defluvii IMMIB APB-9 = DSM 18482 TaxID=1385515 RepID=A0A0A0MB79_9GAMM|nr:C40 family peptidase [Lysobacter defluvii]KGO99482.1 NLP/P60 protein [Lysobacter defluvii IMMIB APB-9 = DSM 18482]
MASKFPARSSSDCARSGRSVRKGVALAFLLALPAVPALAQEAAAPVATAAAADAPRMSGTGSLSGNALALAGDINRLLANGKADAAAEGYKPTDSRVRTLLNSALTLLGTPYRWGGTSPESGFDCSGLVSYVFQQAIGVDLPRVTRDQARQGERVADKSELEEGDLVVFGRKGRVDHVGIYVGEGRFVHAPSAGKDVMVSSLKTGYWSGKYIEGRRIAGSS